MTRSNRILSLSVAMLCVACARQDTTADAAQVADATPAASASAEGAAATDTAAVADGAAMPSAGTAAPTPMPTTVPVPAATSVAAPVATAPPVSNADDQATQAGAETGAPATLPDHPTTAFERATVTQGATPLHPAMTSHVEHSVATDAAAIAKTKRAEQFADLTARAVSPALLRKEDAVPFQQNQHMLSLQIGNIGISNLDPAVRVHFALHPPEADWQNESLAGDATEEFGCGVPPFECLFWMRTGATPPVFYKMHSPKRYVIFWDGKATRWDLRIAPE